MSLGLGRRIHLFTTACLASAAVTLGAVGANAGVSIAGLVAALGPAMVAGLGLGALELFVLALVEPLWYRLTSTWFARSAEPTSPVVRRQRIVGWHAAATAALLGIGVLVVGVRTTLVRLRTIQDQAVLELLVVVAVTGLALLALCLAVGASFVLVRCFAALDRFHELPWPHSRRTRQLTWMVMPLLVVTTLALHLLTKTLGPLSLPLWLVLVLAVQWGCQVLWALSAGRWRGRSGLRWAGAVASLALTVVAAYQTQILFEREPESLRALDTIQPVGPLLGLVRAVTDFDGDGTSALLAGGDCDGFSALRGPAVDDIPGNGIDEDCDGQDAQDNQPFPIGKLTWDQLPAERIRPYDVIWFVVEAMRGDRASFLGYERPTTPNLDELGKTSLVFPNALSQSSATMLSFPSMLTGVDPDRLIWREQRGRLQVAKEHGFLSDRLKAKGYQTGFVSSKYFRGRLPGLLEGWDWIGYLDPKQRVSSGSAAALGASFLARARAKKAPVFLVIYLPAPHAPYVDHGPGYTQFGKTQLDHYDQELQNVDRHIGFVLDVIKSDPARAKRTIVIVNGDHGEEFEEHGGTQHARTCHIESVHPALLFHAPGLPPARVEQRVGLVDVVPTILQLVGAPLPSREELDGNSLLLTAYAPDQVPRQRPFFCSVVSQNAAQGSFLRSSVRSEHWVLLKERRGTTGLTLFDSERDPEERDPLPLRGEAKRIAQRLDEWHRNRATGNLAEVPLTDAPASDTDESESNSE